MAKKSIFRFGRSSAGNIEAEDYTGITKFKFQELSAATKNFAAEFLLGVGEYGRTFKGCLKRSGQAKRKLVYGKEFTALADPLLNCHYPEQGLYQALSLAAECLGFEDASRPRMGHVVNVLSNLASEIYDQNAIQVNRAGTLAIGNDEKEKLRDQWQHVWFDFEP
ncbi:hypothetical protein MKX03_002197 [Papaver bracteatum]|nr:hypothetical protein MKX03_002197 [Papaver bracteatum]